MKTVPVGMYSLDTDQSVPWGLFAAGALRIEVISSMASRASRWRRPVLVAAIVLIALLLRLRAAFLLPVDFDEPIYHG
jgi:hypothetical protein